MLDAPRVWWIARNRLNGELLRSQRRDGSLSAAPMLYESEHRARNGIGSRHMEVENPPDWEILPVRLTLVRDEGP